MPGVYCVLLTLCLPRSWVREVGVLVLLGWEMCLQDLGVLMPRTLGTVHSPTPGPAVFSSQQ